MIVVPDRPVALRVGSRVPLVELLGPAVGIGLRRYLVPLHREPQPIDAEQTQRVERAGWVGEQPREILEHGVLVARGERLPSGQHGQYRQRDQGAQDRPAERGGSQGPTHYLPGGDPRDSAVDRVRGSQRHTADTGTNSSPSEFHPHRKQLRARRSCGCAGASWSFTPNGGSLAAGDLPFPLCVQSVIRG